MRLLIRWLDHFREKNFAFLLTQTGVLIKESHHWQLDGWFVGFSFVLTHFRFSFLHTEDGAIGEVRYPPGEDVHVINIKKGLVASLLSRPAPEVRRCEMVT